MSAEGGFYASPVTYTGTATNWVTTHNPDLLCARHLARPQTNRGRALVLFVRLLDRLGR